MNGERVLVTGANGFVGAALIPRLLEEGFDVWALERYVSNRYNIPTNRAVKTVFADLTDHLAIDGLIRQIKPEIIIHLAALSPVATSYDRWQEYLETNFNATVNLAESGVRHDPNLKQFVFAGSSECYGNQKTMPIRETAEYKPNSPYAVSKVASVTYLQYLHEAYGFPVTIMMPFNSYGRTSCRHFVTEKIISQMLKGNTVCLGDPSPIRDLLYIDDHVEAYLSTLTNEAACGENFNFCTGKGISIKDLVSRLMVLTDFHGEIVWNKFPNRPLDIHTLVGDNRKAFDVLGWKPHVNLDEGLQRTVSLISMGTA